MIGLVEWNVLGAESVKITNWARSPSKNYPVFTRHLATICATLSFVMKWKTTVVCRSKSLQLKIYFTWYLCHEWKTQSCSFRGRVATGSCSNQLQRASITYRSQVLDSPKKISWFCPMATKNAKKVTRLRQRPRTIKRWMLMINLCVSTRTTWIKVWKKMTHQLPKTWVMMRSSNWRNASWMLWEQRLIWLTSRLS